MEKKHVFSNFYIDPGGPGGHPGGPEPSPELKNIKKQVLHFFFEFYFWTKA